MYSVDVAAVLGAVAAIVLTILLYVKVLPKKLDGKLEKPIFQKLHDYFHFQKLYIEEVLKFLFVLATVSCVCIGLFLLLSYVGWGSYKTSTFGTGLLVMLVGPVVLRLIYEGVMMFILLVKNVLDINNKLKAPEKKEEE